MPFSGMLISLGTILRKDLLRILRIWPQTFLPSVITSILYFLIFGAFLGERIGEVDGYSYVSFVIPGLVMLAVVTNSFSNVATVFFTSKFFMRNIDELLVSPTPPWVIIAGFVLSGMVRGILVGIAVIAVSLFFAPLEIAHPVIVLLFLVLTSLIFSLGGLVNGIYAKSFDAITIVPTFVLTPLVYLGGVFYSIHILPPIWQTISLANPVLYLVNGFRFGFLGSADVSLSVSLSILFSLITTLLVVNMYLLKKGLGLKQ